MPVLETLLGKVRVSEEDVREIITIELKECFHWACPGSDVGYGDVMEFLSGSRDPVLLGRITRYTLIYVENFVLSNYAYMKALDEERAQSYLDSMRPLLMRLRRLYQLVNTKPYDICRELVTQMLHACLENGIDPF